MSQSAGKVGSAVPEGRPRRCSRCFAHVPAKLDYCPDCGAPLEHADPTASDAVVEQELAKANLLRVRKDFRNAEDQCLAVLRKLPNNVSANVLLGDICYERGDFHQAAEWYELALDLDPRSVPTQQKLVDARRLSDPGIDLSGLDAVGIAGPRTRIPTWAWASILAIVILLAAAAILPKRPGATTRPVVKTNVDAPKVASGGQVGELEAPLKESEPVKEPAPIPAQVSEDRELLAKYAQLPEVGALLLDATYDPRSKELRVTFVAGEEPAVQAVALARAILKADAELQQVSLRGIKDGKSAFFAAANRDRMPADDAANPEPDQFLSQVWPTANPADAAP